MQHSETKCKTVKNFLSSVLNLKEKPSPGYALLIPFKLKLMIYVFTSFFATLNTFITSVFESLQIF